MGSWSRGVTMRTETDSRTIPPGLPNVVGIMGGGCRSNLALLDTGTGPLLAAGGSPRSSLSVTFWTFLRKNYALEFKGSLAQTNWTTVAAIRR